MDRSDYDQYTDKVRTIKTKNLPGVAARMCRCLRDFPRAYEARSVLVNKGLSSEHYEPTGGSGRYFDTVWDENVGSLIAGVQGLSMSLAKSTLDMLYLLQDFCIRHTDELLGKKDKTASFTTDYTNIRNNYIFNGFSTKISSVKLVGDVTTGYKSTYCGLGYFLDQKTLNEDEARMYDLYEFGKWIATLDVTGALWIINRQSTSTSWDQAVRNGVGIAEEIGGYIEVITKMVYYVCVQISDLGHLVDGLAALSYSTSNTSRSNSFISGPVASFNPASAAGWTKPANIQATGWTTTIKAGPKKSHLAFKVSSPYRLESVSCNKEELKFALTSSTADSAIYLADEYFFENSDVKFTFSSFSEPAGTFVSSKVQVYLFEEE